MMPLDYNAFIRSISSKADGSISFFLGAGASVSSGIPTASQLIWEFNVKYIVKKIGFQNETYKI